MLEEVKEEVSQDVRILYSLECVCFWFVLLREDIGVRRLNDPHRYNIFITKDPSLLRFLCVRRPSQLGFQPT